MISTPAATRAGAAAQVASHWHWPIDLTRYDRTPALAPAEHAALAALGWELRRGRGHAPHRPQWAAIERLLRPLDDARQSLFIPDDPYHRRSARDAVAIILHACAITERAFWAWSPSTWIDKVLAASQQAFLHTYQGWVDGAVRPDLMAIAYLLGCFMDFRALGPFNRHTLAQRVFGPALVQQAVDPIMTTLREWGYRSARRTEKFPGLVGGLLLHNRSPYLADLTAPVIEQFRHQEGIGLRQGSAVYGVHRALAALGLVAPPLRRNGSAAQPIEGVDSIWIEWVERWTATSTLTAKVRQTLRTILFKVGRWLAQQHAQVHEPAQWTRELRAAYLAWVERLCVGGVRAAPRGARRPLGAPLVRPNQGGLHRGGTHLLL